MKKKCSRQEFVFHMYGRSCIFSLRFTYNMQTHVYTKRNVNANINNIECCEDGKREKGMNDDAFS